MSNILKRIVYLIAILNFVQILQCSNLTTDLHKLREIIDDLAEYLKVSAYDEQHNCVQLQCKFVCFNGRISDIVSDLKETQESTTLACPTIEELCIYNYEFPNGMILRNFLGEYGDKVKILYIATSNITDVEGGAFANGIFTKISFEKLQLKNLRKNFFEKITSSFQALSVIQKEQPLASVNDDFLDNVKYQIKYLTMQVGITCVRNLTASANLLNNLQEVDFSYNDFSRGLLSTTFDKLSVVEKLDLSNSHISFLPENIFSDMLSNLQLLDLSNNELTTISSNIFGWKPISRDLKIVATNNNWNCSCELRTQMVEIFRYQEQTKIFCVTPQRYANWSVMDTRLCPTDNDDWLTTAIITSTPRISTVVTSTPPVRFSTTTSRFSTPLTTTTPIVTTTTTHSPTTDLDEEIISTPPQSDFAQLKCHAATSNLLGGVGVQPVRKPSLVFDIARRSTLAVDVLIPPEGLNSSYGLMWFNKVTGQFYKLEFDYGNYGLGCYGSVTTNKTVENLIPDVAYTFCFLLKDQLTASPFNCKSIHVSGNVAVRYSAWLTRDMRVTGISLSVLGIVLFVFLGILLVFLMLKRKPTLLKGSKRVATTNGRSNEIIVFPKDTTIENFRQKEQMLAKRNSKSIVSTSKRRNSTVSIESNQSYMNANLYEELPAYLKFSDDQFKFQGFNTHQSSSPPAPYGSSYSSPITTTSSADNLVRYAEIPSRAKRISSDPLPALPNEDIAPALPLSQCPDRMDDLGIEYLITLESKL